MPGHDPQQAFTNFIRPMREALQCIMQERLFLADRSVELAAGSVVPIDIGMAKPVLLRAEPTYPQIGITIAQTLRIHETESRVRQERFTVSVIRYYYALTTVDRKEILAFHWTPETNDPNQPTFPHLHVGAINVDPDSPIRPDTFHKMHIPTSPVSVEAVIRLAITELNVRPLRPDWEQVLARTAHTAAMVNQDAQR